MPLAERAVSAEYWAQARIVAGRREQCITTPTRPAVALVTAAMEDAVGARGGRRASVKASNYLARGRVGRTYSSRCTDGSSRGNAKHVRTISTSTVTMQYAYPYASKTARRSSIRAVNRLSLRHSAAAAISYRSLCIHSLPMVTSSLRAPFVVFCSSALPPGPIGPLVSTVPSPTHPTPLSHSPRTRHQGQTAPALAW